MRSLVILSTLALAALAKPSSGFGVFGDQFRDYGNQFGGNLAGQFGGQFGGNVNGNHGPLGSREFGPFGGVDRFSSFEDSRKSGEIFVPSEFDPLNISEEQKERFLQLLEEKISKLSPEAQDALRKAQAILEPLALQVEAAIKTLKEGFATLSPQTQAELFHLIFPGKPLHPVPFPFTFPPIVAPITDDTEGSGVEETGDELPMPDINIAFA